MNVPSSQVLRRQLALARATDDVASRDRELRERLPLDRAQHGHNEALRRGDGDADVRGREPEQRVLGVLHVDVAVAHQRVRADLREQVGDGDADVGIQLARARDELVRARHVGRDRQLEDRRLPRGGEAARDRLADVRQRHRLDVAGSARRPAQPARGDLAALDVLGDDAAVGPGAAQRREVDAALAGDPARERRGLDAAAVRRARARRLAVGDALGRRGCRRRDPLRARDRARAPRPASPRSAACRCPGLRRLRELLACLADPRDRLTDRRLALGQRDPQQHAGVVGLDLLRDLVGVDLEQRLALRDRVAFLLEPLRDRSGFHALAEPRQLDLAGHGLLPPPCA